jgi:hypothetical protein
LVSPEIAGLRTGYRYKLYSNRRTKQERKPISPGIHWVFYREEQEKIEARLATAARRWCGEIPGEQGPAPKWAADLHCDGAPFGRAVFSKTSVDSVNQTGIVRDDLPERAEGSRVRPLATPLAADAAEI